MKSLFRAKKNGQWVYGTVHVDQQGVAHFLSPAAIRNIGDYELSELKEMIFQVEIMSVEWGTLEINMGSKYVPYDITNPKKKMNIFKTESGIYMNDMEKKINDTIDDIVMPNATKSTRYNISVFTNLIATKKEIYLSNRDFYAEENDDINVRYYEAKAQACRELLHTINTMF